jgi:26 proteasome complex subunit DSS1
LQAFEEDDEFEEFEQDNWDSQVEDHYNLKQWEEDWDDEVKEDDFTQQLRQELSRTS